MAEDVIKQDDTPRAFESLTEEAKEYYVNNVKPRLYQLAIMISEHAPERDVYNFLGINEAQFYIYKRLFPEFRNAVTQGKFSMISRMEDALLQAATGGKFEESEITNIYSPQLNPVTGEVDMVLSQKREKIMKKVVQPNVKAIEMYLVNKDPANWKRTQSDFITQNTSNTTINVTNEQLQKMIGSFQSSFMDDPKALKQAELVAVNDVDSSSDVHEAEVVEDVNK